MGGVPEYPGYSKGNYQREQEVVILRAVWSQKSHCLDLGRGGRRTRLQAEAIIAITQNGALITQRYFRVTNFTTTETYSVSQLTNWNSHGCLLRAMVQAPEVSAKDSPARPGTTGCVAFGRIQPCESTWMGDTQSWWEFTLWVRTRVWRRHPRRVESKTIEIQLLQRELA